MAGVAIVVEDGGPFVHHLLTAADVRAVIALIEDVAIGLVTVTLALGPDRAPDDDDEEDEEDGEREVDPFLGRSAIEAVPGVYMARSRGHYEYADATILLRAAIHGPDLALREPKSIYLRVQALAALINSLSHHWYRNVDESVETIRAREATQHTWLHEVALPYLAEAYPAEVAAFAAWTTKVLGVPLPLGLLVDDPRLTREDGTRRGIWGYRSAICTMFEQVEAEASPLDVRFAVARDLHYAEEYDVPRAILATLIARDAGDIAAHTLLGDIDVHDERFADAEARARTALAIDPAETDAWIVLVDALQGQARWADVVEAATRGIACAVDGEYEFQLEGFVSERIKARLVLGHHAGVEHDVTGLFLGCEREQATAAAGYARSLAARDRRADALAVIDATLALDLPSHRRRDLDELRAELA